MFGAWSLPAVCEEDFSEAQFQVSLWTMWIRLWRTAVKKDVERAMVQNPPETILGGFETL